MAIYSGIVLTQASHQPMYAQIVEQIKRLVGCGDWPPGHEIPSIRALASGLKVSVITVKRAYAELENMNMIETHQGKPSVVAIGVPDLSVRMKEEELNELLLQSIEIARQLGIKPSELHDKIRTLVGEYYS